MRQHHYMERSDVMIFSVIQRALISFEDRLTESRGAVALQYVRLCKALGGGWRSGAE